MSPPSAPRRLACAAALLSVAACAAPRAPVAPVPAPAPAAPRVVGALPPVPPRTGTLAIDVVYPGEGQALAVRDSNFIFGNVGTGGASLTIDGAPVPVAPNGAFLAFLPVPADGRYDLQATAGGASVQSTRTVRVPGMPGPPAAPAPAAPAPAQPAGPTAEAPRVGIVSTQRADRTTVGTAVPGSGTPYNWFFPNATRLDLIGRQGGQYRVRLTADLSVWVDTADVDLLAGSTPAVRGSVSNVTANPEPGYVDVRLSTSQRLPFRVDGSDRALTITVYGAQTRTNILQYGETDPLIHRLDWEQVSDDLYRVRVDLNEPLWGFQPMWDAQGNLVVRIHRTPAIDPQNPLRGLLIAVDAGHPPGGAIGPTRLTEAEATLAVTRQLIPMLQQRGARVLDIRSDSAPLGPAERVVRAMEADADLFLSVHFDAFGDGTNPFQHYGTHVLFNQPHSLDFARAMQRELLPVFGLPDLGIRRQDVAVIRISSMPSVLTETMFMMFPEQEAALRSPEGVRRIAEAHLRGIEAFLAERATTRVR